MKLWLPVHCPSNRHTERVRRGPGSLGHGGVALQSGGGSSEQQRGLGAVTAGGRAPHARVPAGQGAAARGGGTRHGGQMDLVVGLVGKPPGVASLVAALAVGRVLRVSRGSEGALEAGGAGGAVPAEQHRGAGLVQTHRPHKPPLRLWKHREKKTL